MTDTVFGASTIGLEGRSRSVLSNVYRLQFEDVTRVIELRLSASTLLERATFTWEEKSFGLRRTSLLRRRFALRCDKELIASAEQPSRWKQSCTIALGSGAMSLRASGRGGIAFDLWDMERRAVGQITCGGFLDRAVTALVPAAVSVPERVFLVWLALLIRDRYYQQ